MPTPHTPSSSTEIRTRFAVYGAFLERGRVLTVRRSDGHDAGRLDLPGGPPREHEQFSETLARTLDKQTGARVVATGPWESFDVHVAGDDAPRAVRRETGVWCTVLLAGLRSDVAPAGALLSVEWTPIFGWEDRTDLSAQLRAVLDAVCL